MNILNHFQLKHLLQGMEKVKNITNDVSKCWLVNQLNFTFTSTHLRALNLAITTRRVINTDTKNLGDVSEFNRSNPQDVELKGMAAEYALSTLLFHSTKFNTLVNVKSPALVEINLKKNEPDFSIINKYNSVVINFDVKGQWLTNEYVTINKKSHERYDALNDFYCICLITRDSLGEPADMNYYVMTKKFFNDNAELISKEHTNNHSDYYRIKIESILKRKEAEE